jgi:RNA polymerase sigma-70 factor (ECF subfamily)
MPSRLKAALATVHPLSARGAEPTDAMLVARCCAGDPRAEEALYLRHVGYVTSLCLRLLGNRDEAEDAAQDTFVDVLQQLSSLRDPDRLKQWIARVAVHKVHRRFRRRKLLRALGLYCAADHDIAVLAAAAHSTPEQAAELERLSQLLGGLPDDQRAPWVLRYVDGYKLDEVARLCACSLATVKRRIGAADAVVREHVRLEEAPDE